MADNTEKERINNMEDQMKQLITAVQQMSNEIKILRANPVHVPALISIEKTKQKGSLNVADSDDDNMPDLEDDPIVSAVKKVKPEETKIEQDKRFAKLEEQIRQLQGSQSQSPTDLSVYAKVKVPNKFKMPEFEKYDGTSCPRAHLQMYLVRMTQYVNNAPLMINSFQASLTGPALRWYITKKINLFETWEEVNDAFLKQYKFIMDITPSREDLERAEKKKTESFKEYAIRWRNLAAQVSPEPTEQELKRVFIKTLPYEYRTRMVTTTVDSFNQLIPVGEQIEIGLRDGWFDEPASSGKRFTARKEKEPAAEVNAAYTQQNRENRIQSIQVTGGQQQNIGRQSFPRRTNRRQFTPLPGSLSQVLVVLRKKGLLTSEPKRPNPEQFGNYDSSKKCDYHMGEIGHSTDDCFTLKHKIQNLLDTKAFSFQTARPNIQENPLPDHVGEVNAVFEKIITQVEEVFTGAIDEGLADERGAGLQE